jgi:hypothetical protein
MNRAPLRPLSIGNVVSTGLVLYRSNLKTYFGIALQAYLWIVLPLILLGVASGLFIASRQYPWGLFTISLLLLLAGIGKYLTNSALISRLAYQELIGQPESESTARQYIDPKIWKFWTISISVGLQLVLIYLIVAIAFGIIAGVAIFAFRTILGPVLTGFLTTTVIVLGVMIILSWYFARWMIAEVPLAIEGNITANDSIKRSWDLTQNSALRVQGIVLVAFLVTIPITALTNYAPQILFARAIPGSTLFWTGTAISFIFSLIGSVLVLPLWQTIKSAIYYDLRTRREGLDIQLRQGKNDSDDNDFI